MHVTLSIDKIRVSTDSGVILLGLNNMNYDLELSADEARNFIAGFTETLAALKESGLKL